MPETSSGEPGPLSLLIADHFLGPASSEAHLIAMNLAYDLFEASRYAESNEIFFRLLKLDRGTETEGYLLCTVALNYLSLAQYEEAERAARAAVAALDRAQQRPGARWLAYTALAHSLESRGVLQKPNPCIGK